MDMRGLSTFIADLRKDSTQTGGEKARVEKELAKIRSKFQANGELSGYDRKKYVCKLMYISILGYEVDFGHIEAIRLISSTTHSEKTVGYLACNLLIRQESELMTLLVNQLKLDLYSKHETSQCLALNFLANIWNKEFAESVVHDIQAVFFEERFSGRVRKKAAITLLQLIRNYDGHLEADRIARAALDFLELQDLGASNAALALLEEILPHVPDQHEKILVKCVGVLSRIVLGKQTPNDYIYFGVPTPWTQCKLLRIVNRIEPTSNPTTRSYLLHCLNKICNATEKLMNDYLLNRTHRGVNNRINAMNSVFFEAINVISTYHEEGHVPTVSAIIGLYLSTPRDPYGIYVGLRALGVFAESNPMACVQNLSSVYRKVGDCIYHIDASIQRLAIDVLRSIAAKENVEEIVGELLLYLEKSPSDIQPLLIETIVSMAEKYCTSESWFIDMFVGILRKASNSIGRSVWMRLYEFVNSRPASHAHAGEVFRNLLEEANIPEALVLVSVHLLKICDDTSAVSDGLANLIERIHKHFSSLSPTAQAELLSCYFVFFEKHRDNDLRAAIQAVFHENMNSVHLEVQTQACEYSAFIAHTEGVDPHAAWSKRQDKPVVKKSKSDFADLFSSSTELIQENSEHALPSPHTSFVSNIDDMFSSYAS